MQTLLPPLMLLCMSASPEAEAETVAAENTGQVLPLKTGLCLSLHVRVTDTTGEPVVLDAYESRNLETGEILASATTPGTDSGRYLLVHDLELNSQDHQGSPILFTGVIAGEEVVRQEIIIGQEAGHLHLLYGSLDLQLQ